MCLAFFIRSFAFGEGGGTAGAGQMLGIMSVCESGELTSPIHPDILLPRGGIQN